jgi:hypothetical protein
MAARGRCYRRRSGVLGKLALGQSEGDGITAVAATMLKRTLDPFYTVGGKTLALPLLPGIVRTYEMGLEWVLAEGSYAAHQLGRRCNHDPRRKRPQRRRLEQESDLSPKPTALARSCVLAGAGRESSRAWPQRR